jgi:hypothetical protein
MLDHLGSMYRLGFPTPRNCPLKRSGKSFAV